MNKRLSTLQTQFTQKLLAAAKAGALHVTDPRRLPACRRSNWRRRRKRRRTARSRAMSCRSRTRRSSRRSNSLTSHETRQKLLDASLNRAEHGDANDTRATISEIAQLRAKKAALFGKANWADYTLYDQMAQNRDTAVGFLDRLAPATAAKERQEWADIVALAKSQGATFQPTAADWNFYSEQIRKNPL